MAKLNVEQKNISELLGNDKADFLIPNYQRPYAWEKEECETLWDDIFEFAIPDKGAKEFDPEAEYFLGPIVTFGNSQKQLEVIDGQQRLTTLMLLLRAFYEHLQVSLDPKTKSTKAEIEKCLWKIDEFGDINKDKLKIDSQVASDDDKEEFLSILKEGTVKSSSSSKYAKNYLFFKEKIEEFNHNFSTQFIYFPRRILKNCILLPIEADSQDTALRIFSTLNNRGKPLSDSDIFKAKFYEYFDSIGKKDEFVKRWQKLEEGCNNIFDSRTGVPMDELFTRYMYYLRAQVERNATQTTVDALRRFYESTKDESNDKYAVMKKESTLKDLEDLLEFWQSIYNQDEKKFSEEILKRLFVLNYAPNGMWNNVISVYFMTNKDKNNNLEETKFLDLLKRLTAFIFTYQVYRPGVNALRTPIFPAMWNIVNKQPVDFSKYKYSRSQVEKMLDNFEFRNGKPITKSMLAWWAFEDKDQQCLSIHENYDIEHIYAKNRFEIDKSLTNKKNIELLGNKSLLEKRINIRVSDYRFSDKINYYKGFKTSTGKVKEGTHLTTLLNMSTMSSFEEKDILERDRLIKSKFISFLDECDLISK